MHRLANYFLAKGCPLFRRLTDPPNLFSSLPPELRNELRLRELETPWRESRERGSLHEGSLLDTHSVSAGWFVFPPATSFHAKSYFSSARKRKAFSCK